MPASEIPPRPVHVAVDYTAAPHSSLWLTMQPSPIGRSQVFSRMLLRELMSVHQTVAKHGGAWPEGDALQPVQYLVLRSGHPDYFSLGGDIAYFRDCIRHRDASALREYSRSCLDLIHAWATGLECHTTSIALVQGRALGGGFEAALAADYLIAEEHGDFGFPEILFGLFPCSGGMSLLAQRVGVRRAERMLGDPRMYTAGELLTMGIVDQVCPRGQGHLAVERYIASHARHREARLILRQGRNRLSAMNYGELCIVVDEWVDLALNLKDEDLRVLDTLVRMQQASLTPAGR
jgi:DSF synthase